MNTTERVVFRCYENQSPQWEAYGIESAVYGSGEKLDDARADIKSAISLLHEVDEESIELDEFQERLARPGDDQYPDLWVRALHDYDPNRMLARRDVQELVKKVLQKHPEYVRTFSNGVASTGDIIAVVALKNDMLYDTMEQIGSTDLIYLCMPDWPALYWQTLFTSEAPVHPGVARRVADLGLGDCATVSDFMRATHATVDKAENFLVSA